MPMSHHDHGSHEMHPPSHEGHEMQMSMQSSIDIADPMSRESSGTSLGSGFYANVWQNVHVRR